jgi:hypothetical protein
MTNEERAKEFVKDFAEVYDPFDYMSGAAHEGSVIRLTELLTQVRNEAIEDARKDFIKLVKECKEQWIDEAVKVVNTFALDKITIKELVEAIQSRNEGGASNE